MPVRSGIFFNFRREKSTAFERKYTKDENISPRYFTISAVLKKYSTCRSFICDIKTLTWLSTRKNTFHLSLSPVCLSACHYKMNMYCDWIRIFRPVLFYNLQTHLYIHTHSWEQKRQFISCTLTSESTRAVSGLRGRLPFQLRLNNELGCNFPFNESTHWLQFMDKRSSKEVAER